MHSGDDMPQVTEDASLPEALLEMTNKGLGMTAVVNSKGCISGVFTDGDLRRILDSTEEIRDCKITEVMTRDCQTARADMLAAEALQIIQERRINGLPIVDDAQRLIGVVAMHDLLRAGVV
jgi:arabinose-5-phosphate isomerase